MAGGGGPGGVGGPSGGDGAGGIGGVGGPEGGGGVGGGPPDWGGADPEREWERLRREKEEKLWKEKMAKEEAKKAAKETAVKEKAKVAEVRKGRSLLTGYTKPNVSLRKLEPSMFGENNSPQIY